MTTTPHKQAAHTPGPWSTRPCGYPNGPHCPGAWTVQHGRAWIATQVDGEANARLIAAAPELLSALRNVADVAASIAEQSGSAQAAFIRDEARAAIAKATGTAP